MTGDAIDIAAWGLVGVVILTALLAIAFARGRTCRACGGPANPRYLVRREGKTVGVCTECVRLISRQGAKMRR